MAYDYFVESLHIRQELGDRMGIANSLTAFAALAKNKGDSIRAIQLLGAEHAIRTLMVASRTPGECEEYEAEVAVLRSTLKAEVFETAWSEGKNMTMDQAIEFALQEAL